jgi:hypothetical protein
MQADDLRRHSLSDGHGGHYGTNLDRNRYGSDNNYLFTVTKYNLESLGLCPCLVDIEIVDTRNGNEVGWAAIFERLAARELHAWCWIHLQLTP